MFKWPPWVLYLCFGFLFYSCGPKESTTGLSNEIRNDLEGYAGWTGINGYFNLDTRDAHSGRHSSHTDSANRYSITFDQRISELSNKPFRKINVSLWVKCLALPAKGSYVVSYESEGTVLKYFSFDLDENKSPVNEWVQLKGSAPLPIAIPSTAEVKIYFWNKGPSSILVDDFVFVMEN